MKNYFNNSQLLYLLFKWRLVFGILAVASIVFSVIFSSPFFMKPKFKSTASLYPANTTSFTNEELNEQMLEIFNSKDIRDSIIKKFDLVKAYKIDTSGHHYYNNLIKLFNGNVSFSKNKYESVNIEVIDEDPHRACNMVWAIIYYFNTKLQNLQKDKYREVLLQAEEHMKYKRISIDSLKRRYDILAKDYGLFDFDKQITEITKGYLGTVDGNGSNINKQDVLKLKNTMQEKGAELIDITNTYRNEVYAYDNFKTTIYDNALYNYNRKNTHYYLISEPFPSDKKSSPTRWVIVFVSTFSTLFFAFIIVAFIENYENLSSMISVNNTKK